MTPILRGQGDSVDLVIDNIIYVRQMLGELRNVANGDGAEMLRYLIEMAYVEAGDLVTGYRAQDQNAFRSVRPTGSY